MNWVVNVRIAGGKTSPLPPDSWSQKAPLSKVLPSAKRFNIPDLDIDAMVRATPAIFEYPMADRDSLSLWTHGRITLLGDAAHPMYPVGSNSAAQAILDARCLADELVSVEYPCEALYRFEQERLPKTAEIVYASRIGGPDRIIDEVEKLSPSQFDNIDDVLGYESRKAIVKGYAKLAGLANRATNRPA